jgi:subtilisin family serine protease
VVPLLFSPTNNDVEHEVALDEVVERLPSGQDRVIPLDPPATLDSLPERIRSLARPHPVLPVSYPESEPRSEQRRHLITSSLTVKLADADVTPELPSGIVIADRPSYAPGHAVLRAADSFAALAMLDHLRRTPGIALAEIQLARQQQKRALPNDTIIGDQWHIKFQSQTSAVSGSDVNVETAWNYGGSGGVKGTGVRIGIIDDGLQTNHPDLSANVDTTNDKDWNGNDSDPSPGTDDDHGTACAGNAAARGNNGQGVTGTAPEATLVGMRLIAAATTDSQEAEALAYLPQLIQVKSNSWGPSDDGFTLEAPGTLTQAALASATSTGRGGRGSIILWAGGNGLEATDNSNKDGYANSIHTIAIGAMDSQLGQAYYSESGANLVCVAPSSGTLLGITTVDRTGTLGYNTSSSPSGGDYTNDFGGTSSATPTAAGITALMLEKNPNLGWRDVQEILIRSAFKVRPTDADWVTNGAGFHFNHKYGAGRIDGAAAVTLAGNWTNLTTATSTTSSQSGLSVAIPDNNSTGVTRHFQISSASIRAEQVTLTTSITHANRGDLVIILTSPSGTQSRLTELHPDTGNNYSGWTFSSVRHWGENSIGTWTLQITDRRSANAGNLTAASLTIHGSPATPVNTGPQLSITSPADGSVFSPGTTLAATVSASDLTATAAPGQVQSVSLFDNGNLISTDTTAPYQFSLNPALGSHSLTATGLDTEGASGSSAAVAFTVVNQAPTITSAGLSATGFHYADEPLTVANLVATDPEGQAFSTTYLWQSSINGVVFTDSADTTSSLPVRAGNAGKLWRCRLSVSDGTQTSQPYLTPAVNTLLRPVTEVDPDSPYSYTSGLVLRGTESTLSRTAALHEFSQGISGSSEWAEILVLETTSLRGWKLRDATGNTLTFANAAVWDAIPAGTLIVVYNGASKDSLLPVDDTNAADFRLVVSSADATRFTGTWPGFGNGGDSVVLRNAADVVQSGLSYGTSSGQTPYFASLGGGRAALFIGEADAELSTQTRWLTTSSATARSLGTKAGPRVPVASLPFTFGGPWTTLPTGLTGTNISTYASELGGDTASTGSARFDATGDALVIELPAAASAISYRLLGNSGSAAPTAGTFLLQESANGTAYTTLATHTNHPTTDTAYTSSPAAATRYLKFLFQTKTSGNIQLDKLSIAGGTAPAGLSLNLAPTSINEGGSVSGTVSLTQAPAADLVVTLESSNAASASVPATVTVLAGQTQASFTVQTTGNTITDGTRTVTIAASAASFPLVSAQLTILDDEPSLDGVTPGQANSTANLSFITIIRNGGLNTPALFRVASGTSLPAGLSLNTASGQISGTLTADAGDYPITIERYNSLGEIVSQSFTLSISAPTSFAEWALSQSLSSAGFTQDDDRDGVANGMEYYFGTKGNSSNHSSPLPTVISGLNVTFWRRTSVTDVQATVEWSPSLEPVSWSSMGVVSSVIRTEGSRQLIQATLPFSPASSPSRFFFRLRAELIPLP